MKMCQISKIFRLPIGWHRWVIASARISALASGVFISTEKNFQSTQLLLPSWHS